MQKVNTNNKGIGKECTRVYQVAFADSMGIRYYNIRAINQIWAKRIAKKLFGVLIKDMTIDVSYGCAYPAYND